MKIAICDDEERSVCKIREDLTSLQTFDDEFSFDEFNDGRSLLSEFTLRIQDTRQGRPR